jgi:P22_AR N-terminal domain.
MDELTIKSVDVLGDAIMATQDADGQIWAGVSYFCRALGMNKGQKDRQTTNVQRDETLKRGCRKFAAGVFDLTNEAVGMRIDFVPLWLAKINITKTMLQEHPDLADKLLQYQLKAKDILADAFLPNRESAPAQICNPSEIQLGELASYLKIMDRVANRQNLAPYKIAENFKKVSEQFGVQLSDDFVNVQEYVQQRLKLEGGAHHG